MVGLDTNILLRAITKDDPAQSTIAARLLETLNKEAPGYINIVVLSEFAWSLNRRYKYSREDVRKAVEALLESTSCVVAERDAVNRALRRGLEHRLDFADALIAELNREAGCPVTLSFDKGAANKAGFWPAL